MFSVLVIGAGTMGKVHVEAYMAMDNVNVAGIVDFREERAQALTNGDTKVFASLEEALQEVENVDVIDVCLPTYLHKEFVKKAADLGKDVICEKPLARNLEDAKEMIDFCREKKVRLFVGHVVRFFPEYQSAKQVVQSGEIGKVGVVRTRRGGIFPSGWNDWYSDFGKSGGVVLDVIIHDFDFLRWCFGDVERVYAKSLASRNFARKDYALVTLRFKSGVIAHVEGSWAHEGFATAFEFAGAEGIIDYDSDEEKPLTAHIRNHSENRAGVAVPESPLKESPYFKELQHFIGCLETGAEPLISPEDAYKAMEISLAALRSIETGRPVALEDSSSPVRRLNAHD